MRGTKSNNKKSKHHLYTPCIYIYAVVGREEVVLDNQQHLTITTKRIKPIYRLTYLTKKLVFSTMIIIIIMKAIFFYC